jgi:signal transduction histidine kinase
MNLLLNGAQAMGGRGTLHVSFTTQDQACRIDFADAGPGIPPEILGKIFTPFLTTKARGSGLGLVTSRRFIEAHHGSLAVDCPAGGGTVATVMLPLAEAGWSG